MKKKIVLELASSKSHKIDTEISNFYYSHDGHLIAFATCSEILVISSENLTQICVIKIDGCINIEDLQFSPLGNFLITWVQLGKESQYDNLCIWEVCSGLKLRGWVMKNKLSWPLIQWSQDESITGIMLQKGKIIFYQEKNFSNSCGSLSKPGMNQFFIGPGKDPHVCVFVPYKSSEPGFVEIYDCRNLDQILMKKAFFGDSIEVNWNKDGNAMLIQISKDMDKDNYYGKKTLQYINIIQKFDSSVTENFVHDAQWNPNGIEFALIHGNMPKPKTTMYDLKAIKKLDLMDGEARNKLMFDPTGRILMVGGFGSLPGVIDFWDVSKNEFPAKLGHATAFSSSHHSWSPDGRFFFGMCAKPKNESRQ